MFAITFKVYLLCMLVLYMQIDVAVVKSFVNELYVVLITLDVTFTLVVN